MNAKPLLIIIFVIASVGMLFSGYLSYHSFFAKTCVLSEGCTSFIGQPACIYGFIIYLALLVIACIMLFGVPHHKTASILMTVSILGLIFSTYTSIKELFFTTCPGGCAYTLLIPSCIYGFVMYLAIFILSIFLVKESPEEEK
jgi:uncharacterized membrane protein